MSGDGEVRCSAKRVVVLGASPKPERYSNQAVGELADRGYDVVPVNPAGREVRGLSAFSSLAGVGDGVDTLTVYVNSGVSEALSDDIARLGPRRIIFNPGAENPELARRCREAGIEVVEGCTLVMLRTGQF